MNCSRIKPWWPVFPLPPNDAGYCVYLALISSNTGNGRPSVDTAMHGKFYKLNIWQKLTMADALRNGGIRYGFFEEIQHGFQ